MAFKSIHDFTVKDARGNHVELGKYKGKPLLMVNVASESDLNHPHYTEVAQLHEKYKHHGLEILPFPFNQVNVHGPNADPIHKYLKSSIGRQEGTDIDNFTKLLVDKTGNIVEHYFPIPPPPYHDYHASNLPNVAMEASPITQSIENAVKEDMEKLLGTDKAGNFGEHNVPTARPSTDAFEKKLWGMATHDSSIHNVAIEGTPITQSIENAVKEDMEKFLGTDKTGNFGEHNVPTARPSTDAFEKNNLKKHFGFA